VPFSADQFFDVFALYNRAFGVVVVVLWLATAGLLGAAWRYPRRYSGPLTALVALLWGWGAVAYHAFAFARINPAAWLFALLFAVEAVALLRRAAGRPLEYFSAASPTSRIGAALVVYALAYPVISVVFVHPYPAAPTFGVPCPTAILTIGLLLTVAERPPASLSVIPAIWGVIGGSAAVLLAVPSDYVLLAAGVFLFVRVLQSRYGPGRHLAHGR
jgi:hypothetical protein